MTTAQMIMHPDVASLSVRDTMDVAAQRMHQLDVGALPICDGEGRPVGIVTDRDIVVKCLAPGHDPRTTTAGEMAQGTADLLTVGSDAGMTEVLALMKRHQIRRLPVVEDGKLVGIISEADIARGLPESTVGEFVGSVCAQHLPMTTTDL
ncbi:CBS domain-containing protein [Nocardia ignorata]|uniref:CBS domain protein n=1 Tax=Nocardia ignorata TaxID=145285 RepID=A0A4R6P630_NOCIG|nr:CBS domain-containing protein [Nocardia ignorata]TDP33157.1 CBS domain protein [Nocardia ignorata]